jgi:ABC-type nitrate/sulfonate/bicarbonate transport system permease component
VMTVCLMGLLAQSIIHMLERRLLHWHLRR